MKNKLHLFTCLMLMFSYIALAQSPIFDYSGPDYKDSLYRWHWGNNSYYRQLDALQSDKPENKPEIRTLALGDNAILANTSRIWNCQNLFWSGTNLAWRNFAQDIGATTDIAYFRSFFAAVKAAGGNSVRWWLHTNGVRTPLISSTGNVTGLGNNVVTQLNQVLDAAWAEGIGVDLCLFSFDMLQNQGNNAAANRLFLSSAANIRSYITNALTPMVNGVKNHPALLCWEICNEPEGMTSEFGWTPTRITMLDVQRMVNLITGALHRLDPNHKVTNGAWSFRSMCDNLRGTNERNYYTDARLIAAGGDALGTLDFYQVHYYDWAGTALSPFHHPKSFWGLDKELMVGEFFVRTTFGVAPNAMYENLYTNGYFGAWGWQYNESALWNAIRPAMQTFAAAHRNLVTVNKNSCSPLAINQNEASTIVLAYPNPFSNSFGITIDGDYNFKIYDMNGTLVESGDGKGTSTDIGIKLHKGLYVLKIISNDELIKTIKISKL